MVAMLAFRRWHFNDSGNSSDFFELSAEFVFRLPKASKIAPHVPSCGHRYNHQGKVQAKSIRSLVITLFIFLLIAIDTRQHKNHSSTASAFALTSTTSHRSPRTLVPVSLVLVPVTKDSTQPSRFSLRLKSSNQSIDESSSGSQTPEPDKNDNNRWASSLSAFLKRRLQSVYIRVIALQTRLLQQYLRLSRRRQRLVAMAAIVFCVGALGRVKPRPTGGEYRQPVEISYSLFLDLLELQKDHQTNGPAAGTSAGSNKAASQWALATSQLQSGKNQRMKAQVKALGADAMVPIPVMDHVRIGTDRIVYRLSRPRVIVDDLPASPDRLQSQQEGTTGISGSPSVEMTGEAVAKASPSAREAGDTVKRISSRIASSIQLLKKSSPTKQAVSAKTVKEPYMMAYTTKIAASPELMASLRSSNVPFAAMTPPKESKVAENFVRSTFLVFYFMIMWRLYQTMSSIGGGRGKDTPGKLARSSDLPLASFDDIQGIDDAKQEVMELVDVLRYPSKYAILGARAPTGL
jgi:hypothetical protein